MEKDYSVFVKIIKETLPTYIEKEKPPYLKEILRLVIRKVEVVSRKCVSVEANKKREELNEYFKDGHEIKCLTNYEWNHQVNKGGMRDEGRKIFHWEHYVPVNQMLDNLIRLFEENNFTHETIEKELRTAQIWWITKEENKRLDDNNHRTKREDPDRAYEEANIIKWKCK